MSESFTGYRRAKKTRPGVLVSEIASKSIISVAGIGVIAAVFLVFVFLASVAIPLAAPTKVDEIAEHASLAAGNRSEAAFLGIDEFLIAGFKGRQEGRTLRHFRLDTGEVLGDIELFDSRPTALSYTQVDGWLAAGFEDGSTTLGRVYFDTRFYEDEDVPAALHALRAGEVGVLDGNAVERTPVGQLRQQRLTVELDPPIPGETNSPIILIDKTVRSSGPVVATVNQDGVLSIASVNIRQNILTGQVTVTTTGGTLDISELDSSAPPISLLVNAFADTVYLVWSDGRYARVDARNLQDIKVVEQGSFFGPGETDRRVTVATFLLGRGTILVGDTEGTTSTWFTVRNDEATASDKLILVNASRFDGASPVTTITSSSRKRLIAVGHADGSVNTFYVTSEANLASINMFEEEGGSVIGVAFAPRDDALLGVSANGMHIVAHDSAHPEATVRSLFGRIWYEGNAGPDHIWQSSSGTDAFEAKFGLVPLIFGTLKATVYSMLFGVPIAILAAIYTSEYLHAKLRARIKPAIEMMASLPSVVLGFLAALVIAPFVGRVVPTLLLSFIAIPLMMILAGYLYQLLPGKTRVLMSRHRFVLVLVVVIPLGLLIAIAGGGLFERLFFAGNIRSWLDGQVGSGLGGWVLILIPGSAAVIAYLMMAKIKPRLRSLYQKRDDRAVSRIELGRFLAGLAATVLLALGVGGLLTLIGIDSRASFPGIGPVLGTYVQRNSLIVGFIMGFAIIPIIYTIADDALRSVPDHLRSASLASGATPWQTTVRVVIPTAMSGLFSAVMIGLGRAVGETMIVLMAAGNTPIMEMNIFNGFRTLAANIAVELPEAAANSTHYRVLFLAALTLFLMTFVVNTAAEVVRQRFRKRAYQL